MRLINKNEICGSSTGNKKSKLLIINYFFRVQQIIPHMSDRGSTFSTSSAYGTFSTFSAYGTFILYDSSRAFNKCLLSNQHSHSLRKIVSNVSLSDVEERFKIKLNRFASQMDKGIFNDVIEHLFIVSDVYMGNVNYITVYKDIIFIIREHKHIDSKEEFDAVLKQIYDLIVMINCEYFPLMMKRCETSNSEEFDPFLCELLMNMAVNLSAQESDGYEMNALYYIDDFMNEVIDMNVITFDNYMRVDYVQKVFTFSFCDIVIKCDIIMSISDYVINVLHLNEFKGIEQLQTLTYVQLNEVMADVILDDCDFSLSSLCEILRYYALNVELDDFYRGIRVALNDKQFTLLKTLISNHNAIYKTKIKVVCIQKHF